MISTIQLKEFLGCDDEFLAQLMETFLKESGEGISRLKTASDEKNWPVVKGTAHKMLSSTRIFNIGDISNTLEEIEKLADNGTETGSIPAKVKSVEQSWVQISEEIRTFLVRNKP